MPNACIPMVLFLVVLFPEQLSMASDPQGRSDSSASEASTDFINSFSKTDDGLFSKPDAKEKKYLRSILPGQEKNVWSDDFSEVDYVGRDPKAYTLAKTLSILFKNNKTIDKKWISREGFLQFHLVVNPEGWLSDTRAFVFRPLSTKQKEQLEEHWFDFEGTYIQYLETMASLFDADTKDIRQELLSPEGLLIHHDRINPEGNLAVTLANTMALLNDQQQHQLRIHWISCEKLLTLK